MGVASLISATGSGSALMIASRVHFARPQHLAMRTIAADFGACEQNLESEVTLDLTSKPLQRLTEKLLYLAASQADHVRMLGLHARLVVVLIASVMHEVQLIDEAAVFEQLQCA